MALQLDFPLVFFDLETTGLDVATSRIVEVAMLREEPDGELIEFSSLVNPEIPIPPHTTAIHRIRDEDVVDAPVFRQIAPRILELMEGAAIAGYNSSRFDVPLLFEEMARADVELDLSKYPLIDALTIFQRHEPRTLAGAYARYCGGQLEDAHSALADVRATREVLHAQVGCYDDLPEEVSGLAAYCAQDQSADLAGRLLFDSEGEVVFNFGKHKSQRVKDVFRSERGYYDWLMRSDFPLLTKQLLAKLHNEFLKEG